MASMPHASTVIRHLAPRLALGLVLACTKEQGAATTAATTPGAVTPASAAGAASAQAGAADSAVQRLAAHVQSMRGTDADSTMVVLPEHEQLVSTALQRMRDELQTRHVPTDAHWTALADSVQATAARLPTMTRRDLATVMPTHRRQLLALLTEYRTLTGSPG